MEKLLKDCPFCGGVAQLHYDGDFYADYEFSIRCTNELDCGIVLPAEGEVIGKQHISIKEKYINRWNNRIS